MSLQWLDDDFRPDQWSVKVSEMLVATSDSSDVLLDSAVGDVLHAVRQRYQMDVVFVSEFADGQQVLRHVDAVGGPRAFPEGTSMPLEDTWCQRVVDGRLPGFIPRAADAPGRDTLPPVPFDNGTYLSAPIELAGGTVYGTLCCFSFAPNEQVQARDLRNLSVVARAMAERLDRKAARAG